LIARKKISWSNAPIPNQTNRQQTEYQKWEDQEFGNGLLYGDPSFYLQKEFDQEKKEEGDKASVETGTNGIVVRWSLGKTHAPSPKDPYPEYDKKADKPSDGTRGIFIEFYEPSLTQKGVRPRLIDMDHSLEGRYEPKRLSDQNVNDPPSPSLKKKGQNRRKDKGADCLRKGEGVVEN
jgi:hypothetical protein